MIPNECRLIQVGSVFGAIYTAENMTFLILIGSQREKGNPDSCYCPFEGLAPDHFDTSEFAELLRKFQFFNQLTGDLYGPHTMSDTPEPDTIGRFRWVSRISDPLKLMHDLKKVSIDMHFVSQDSYIDGLLQLTQLRHASTSRMVA